MHVKEFLREFSELVTDRKNGMKQALMFYYLKTRHRVNTVLMYVSNY